MKHVLSAFALAASVACADEDGFVPMFNGRDLSGWVNVNCAPDTWSIKDAVVHCTGKPTGALRTERQYENFILEGEWRHLTSGGNSGFFIWGSPIPAPGVPFLMGIEVQVLDNGFNIKGKNEWYSTHGDIFPIHGATMKPLGRANGMRAFPSEERSKSSPEWNHYRLVASNGTLRLSVNGKEVTGGDECNYRKGYLALESEGAPVEFRNVRIKELPSSGTSAEFAAPLELGWQSLFTGLDLSGWKSSAHWKVEGERLTVDKTGGTISTAREFGDAEFMFDCKQSKDATQPVVVFFRGAEFKIDGANVGKYQRYVVNIRGQIATVTRDGNEVVRLQIAAGSPARSALELRAASADFFNLFARDL